MGDQISRSKYYRLRNVEQYRKKDRESMRRRREANRLAVLSFYSDGQIRCACCGEGREVFLAIDHIHGGGNIERKKTNGGSGRFYLYLIRNDYPPGYQVLCHNCNYAKHHLGVCPHEFEGVE